MCTTGSAQRSETGFSSAPLGGRRNDGMAVSDHGASRMCRVPAHWAERGAGRSAAEGQSPVVPAALSPTAHAAAGVALEPVRLRRLER